MKRLLYVMPVDWGWIVQRPHFLALELNYYYDVKVVYLKQYVKRWKSQKELRKPQNSKFGIYFPMQEKIKFLQILSDYTMKKAIGNLDEYDAVMLGEPRAYRFFMEFKGKIIYDCMDDYEALQIDINLKKEIRLCEDELLLKSDIVFVSSLTLKKKVDLICPYRKTVLVRNGFNYFRRYNIKVAETKKIYQLGYIGTISSWMDFELIDSCLNQFDNIKIHMVGPVHGYKGKNRKRIIFEGIVEHDSLFNVIEKYDCLIMPFIINDIVIAVDPVKLYEYISFGKCIISVYYDEISRFEDFVYFYKNKDDLILLIEKLSKRGFPPKYSLVQQMDFLKENSWEVRGSLINESLKRVWN